ncbi:hypothetical protein ACQP3L_34780, partial [Escherichia coli]
PRGVYVSYIIPNNSGNDNEDKGSHLIYLSLYALECRCLQIPEEGISSLGIEVEISVSNLTSRIHFKSSTYS